MLCEDWLHAGLCTAAAGHVPCGMQHPVSLMILILCLLHVAWMGCQHMILPPGRFQLRGSNPTYCHIAGAAALEHPEGFCAAAQEHQPRPPR